MDNYTRRATVERVIDGDTVVLTVDLGFYCYVRLSCRLFGIDTPELKTPEGKAARDFLKGLLPVGKQVLVASIKPDKFAGRFDGVIYADAIDINKTMLDNGYAVVYYGGAKRS